MSLTISYLFISTEREAVGTADIFFFFFFFLRKILRRKYGGNYKEQEKLSMPT